MSTVYEPHAIDPTAPARPAQTSRALRYVGALIRLSLGWIFLWAFLDKLFGLGHETPSEAAWINGGQPTAGFLQGATSGPFSGFYQDLAGQAWVDWIFMLGLVCIGLALILGIGMRLAAIAGSIMLVLMWSAVLPPANNPFMDDHLVYALVLIALALGNAGDTLGLGRPWRNTTLVQRWPILA